jgi:hypothetical protein
MLHVQERQAGASRKLQGILDAYKECHRGETEGGGRGPPGLIEVGSGCSGLRPGS